MTAMLILIVASALPMRASAPPRSSSSGDATLNGARAARDRGDTSALAVAIHQAHARVEQTPNADTYLRIALLDQWMCEAGYDHRDNRLVKKAAQDGVAAAERAVELSPNSSEAHAVLGDLLGQLIPLTFGGPLRYGPRGTKELDRALALDPNNAEALISRAKAYFFTPAMFGGDKQKATALLKKVAAMDPSADATDTAYIWLANMYLAQRQPENALRAAEEARRLDPDRLAAQSVYNQVSHHAALQGE